MKVLKAIRILGDVAEIIVGASILVISGSNEVGTAPGVEDEDPNAARGSRGEWGNIWKG